MERTVLPDGRLMVPNVPHFEASAFFWDQAIEGRGLAHFNPALAATCYLNYVGRFQWQNGMLPNEGSTGRDNSRAQRHVFGTAHLPDSPAHQLTSGHTQPPLMTPLTLEIARELPATERRVFLQRMFKSLLSYTEWAMGARIDASTGLFTNIHAFEVGMDDTPVWDTLQNEAYLGNEDKISKLAQGLGSKAIGQGRRRFTDGRYGSLEHRASNMNVLTNQLQLRRIRQLGYDQDRIRNEDKKAVLVNHLGFNAILDWSNHALREIAEEIDQPGFVIPDDLQAKQNRLHQAIQTELWYEDPADPSRNGYRSMNARTSELIDIETIDELFPLATPLPVERAELLRNKFTEVYANNCEAVAPRSPYARPGCYWQGGDWPFAREVVNQGLEAQGYTQEAYEHRDRILTRASEPGKYEFEDPQSNDGHGQGRGVPNFGPTAAQDAHWVYLQKAA